MPNANTCIFIGNLTRDPELKYLASGAAVADFSLAINRQWKTESGEKREETTFVDFTIWQKRAEIVAEYCKKGDPLYVQARYTVEEWEKDGVKHRRGKFIVEDFQFLVSRKSGTTAPDASDRRPSEAPRPPKDPDLDTVDAPF